MQNTPSTVIEICWIIKVKNSFLKAENILYIIQQKLYINVKNKFIFILPLFKIKK